MIIYEIKLFTPNKGLIKVDWRQKTIDEVYNGDVEQFKEAYAFAVAEGRRYAIKWQDIADAAITLPEYEVKARDLIERLLGYFPHDCIVLKYEPFLRVLIQNHEQGMLSDEAFTKQAEEHVKLIRNFEMTENACLTYKPYVYEQYKTYLNHYEADVKARLISFLKYEPKLEHSVVGEIWMREVMSQDTFQLPSYITPVDFKVITLIKYREALLEYGKEIADASPLYGFESAIIK
ncbi:hypothetical protein AHMF7605_20945 [Adhaeribacter arboris]|uniref:Uncharacterized protein n=1 Tax=Adhaeribacter arboris TaxID=2072846 RepID=A0A2T2YJX3_9BACT|nr:hypothetical protein [Adhaeribacter arboris]PSR55789.1 hypothetical protein AHMF7605_20945 [Adhaeribacter arboris]